MSNKVILSTGVLQREPLTTCATVNIVNLNKQGFEYITVEVWDWSNYSDPIKLPLYYYDNVLVPLPYKLEAENLAIFYADLNAAGTHLYEIRISYSGNHNIIFNCFGRDSGDPSASQVGNTVLQSSLIKLQDNTPIAPLPPSPPAPPLAPCGGSVWRSTDNCLR